MRNQRPSGLRTVKHVGVVELAVALAVLISVASLPSASAQSQAVGPTRPTAAFEVASIKRNAAPDGPLNAVELNFQRASATRSRNGRLQMEGVPLQLLIELAYNVKEFQIQGGPSWVTSERFDVDAIANPNATFEDMRPMLRALLAERFKLALRQETKPGPVYELSAASDGLNLSAMKEGGCVAPDPATSTAPPRPGGPLTACGGFRRQIVRPLPDRVDRVEGVGILMPRLVEMISDEVRRPIVDKTGFAARFNLRFEFAPSATLGAGPASPDGQPAASSGVSLFTALQEQLGLRLESATGPVPVLVIDRVERPSAN